MPPSRWRGAGAQGACQAASTTPGVGWPSGSQPPALCCPRTCGGPSASPAACPTRLCCASCGFSRRSAARAPSPSSPATAGPRQGGLGGPALGSAAKGLRPRPAACQRPPVLSLQPGRHQDDLWQLWRIRQPGAKGQQDLTQWLGEEEQEGRSLDWLSDSLSPHGELSESEETEAQVGAWLGTGLQRALEGGARRGWRGGACSRCRPRPPQSSEYLTPKRTHSRARTAAGPETGLRQPLHSSGHALREERSGYLPRLLHFFVGQNWFKELFPVFTLEVRGSGAPGKPGRAGGGRASARGTRRPTPRWARRRAWPPCSWTGCSRPLGRSACTS